MIFRPATLNDLNFIISLLQNDSLGSVRECSKKNIFNQYLNAFNEINNDTNHLLLVVEMDKKIIGTMQMSLIPNLTFQGSKRCLIEGVRVAKTHQGQGVGKKMFEWAMDWARQNNCKIIQLTTNKERRDALVFYEKIGFENTHHGLKMYL